MKKIMMFLFALIFLFSAKDVFAQDQYQLTLEKQEGIYFSRRGVNFEDDSYPYYLYKFGDIFAYCIEPGKHISTYTYVGSSDYIDLPFSEELKEKLELIGYYGREYPGHNNVRYSMAAQALIWELTGVDTVTFWTKQYEKGDEIDVSKERNEIMNLVNKHKSLPNFKTSYTSYLKKEIIIKDTNSVLDNYQIINNGNQEVYIKDNTLHIIPKTIGNYNIELKRESYDEYNTIIFVGKGDNSSQKLGRLHFNKEIKTKINVTIKGISLLINKVDESDQPIKIANIKFKLKDVTNNKYICSNTSNCIYNTNKNGTFIISQLDYGEYELEEVEDQIIPGYSWNSEKLHITINDNTTFKYNDELGNYLDLTFKNNSVLASLEINKVGENPVYSNNTISYSEINMVNVFFDLYTIDNVLVKTFATGPKGYIKIDNLKPGKYYLVEKYQLSNYVPQEKIYFELKQDNQYQTSINYKLKVKNILKKGQLEFSKVDSLTNIGIANTIIEIYDQNNILVLTKETDSSGKITVYNLPIGKYYIKEKEANYYYEKTSEIISFSINNDNEVVKATMKNKKIMGKIELEKYGEEFNIINNDINYIPKLLPDIEFNLYTENGKLIDTLKTNENGYLSKELELGKYYLQEKTQSSLYQDNNEKYYFEIKKSDNEAIDVKLVIHNYLKKGGVEFNKEDFESLYGISNTIMEIYNDNNELLLTRKTDGNGKIVIVNLPLGKYYFKEKEANYYFQVTDELVPFEIINNGEMIKTKLTNKKIVGNLEIKKMGENYHFVNNDIIYEKEPLHGIEFIVYDDNNQMVGSIETDKNGYAKYSNLPLGKYYVIEKTNLDKYIDDNNKYYFEIKKGFNNQALDVKIEIVNYLKKGNLAFRKEDSITNIGISNTVIEIYNNKDMLLLTRKTDKNGIIIINDLPLGKYYIKEKEANYYYEITDEVIPFEIKDNKENVKVKMNNNRILGNLEINKLGEKYQIINEEMVYEKILLPNIEFDLFDNNDTLITTLKTDANGYTNYSNLSLGKYYLIEKNTSNNYLTNVDRIYFEIKKDNNKAIDVKLNINNYLKKGSLEFTKMDLATSEGIADTIIEIYDQNNNLWFTKQTDSKGKVIINNLPVGKYYIIEKEANSLYMITNEKVFFEIKEDGEIIKANMTNEKIEVPVLKTDTKESIIANSLFGIMFVFGIGRLLYEKKESY